MKNSLFSFRPDLLDRGGYYLLLGIIGTVLLLFDQRTDLLNGFRDEIDQLIVDVFYVSSNSKRSVIDRHTSIQSNLVLTKKIHSLEKDIISLRARLLDRDLIITDNLQLRKKLALKERQQNNLMLTEVVSTFYMKHQRSFIINSGSNDGVFVGQTVISEDGLIGQVNNVFESASRVLTIIDNKHSLPIIFNSSQYRMLAEGDSNNDLLFIANIDSDKSISVGDEAVTSGLGGVFDYGYKVGYVESVTVNHKKSTQSINIKPFADFNGIKYVFLVFPSDKDTENNSPIIE